MTVATLVTLTRMALVPVFGALWMRGRHEAALWAFALAALSDALDGLLARALDQRTRLGTLLDPAADKLMLLVSFLVAASVGAIPWWLVVVVSGRDALVTLGAGTLALLARGHLDTDRVLPTRVGKYATLLESVTIGLSLLASARFAPSVRPWVPPLVIVTAVFSVTSALQYLARAALTAWRSLPPAPGAPVPRGGAGA